MANSVSWENEPFGTFAPTALARSIIAITRSLPESWLGRRLTLALRRIVLTLLGRTPIDVETLGVRMRLFPHNNVCEKRVLFPPQHFDAHEREILAKHIAADFTFIDVGANVGAYSLFAAAHAGPG